MHKNKHRVKINKKSIYFMQIHFAVRLERHSIEQQKKKCSCKCRYLTLGPFGMPLSSIGTQHQEFVCVRFVKTVENEI